MKRSALHLHSDKHFGILLLIAVVFVFTATAFSLLCGSVSISLSDIYGALSHGAKTAGERIFIYSRLPRTLGSLVVGAALAVSGGIIQSCLANKLASPAVIGVNSGAGLAVTICAVFGIYGGWQLSLFSFLGASVAVGIISLSSLGRRMTKSTVILMGVALNSVLSAISDALIQFFPDIAVMNADFRIGDLSAVSFKKLVPSSVAVIFCLLLLFILSNELDILGFGDEIATGLGLNTRFYRALFLILSALLAGCAVSIAGLVSFVGLMVPHAVRRLGVLRSRRLLPLCALFGAALVTLCDTAARSLFSPYEIPVGIILAFVGAPCFVIILVNRKER